MTTWRKALAAAVCIAGAVSLPAPAGHAYTPPASTTTVQVDVGPVHPWRWANPSLCLENHSSFPMQVHVGEWTKADDLILRYENCGGYGYHERIDVHESYRPDIDACSYTYVLLDNDNKVARMIKYMNTGRPGCWSNNVRKNHNTSAMIGGALGLKTFDTYPPYYVSVMRDSSADTVSYAQDGDRLTFDWYNNLCCQA